MYRLYSASLEYADMRVAQTGFPAFPIVRIVYSRSQIMHADTFRTRFIYTPRINIFQQGRIPIE